MKALLALVHLLLLMTSISSYSGPHSKYIRVNSGGIFFWWQAGAASYIQQNFQMENVAVMGTSAGALTAALLKTESNFELAAQQAISLAYANDIWNARFGLAGIWGDMVEEWLDILLPEELTDDMKRNIHLSVTPSNLLRKPIALSGFQNKSSLIRACMASTHIPFFMNGKLCTKYEGKRYIDGSFWAAVPKPLRRKIWPAELDGDGIFHIDWQHDQEFRKQHEKTSFVSLLTQEGLHDMMNAGYTYMKQLDSRGEVTLLRKS
jgi:hypothetical protein